MYMSMYVDSDKFAVYVFVRIPLISIFIYRQVEIFATFRHGIYVFVCILLHLEGLEADADVRHLVFDITIVQLVAVNHQQIFFSTLTDSLKRTPLLLFLVIVSLLISASRAPATRLPARCPRIPSRVQP